jgi:Family of unknown function (DUF6982)
MEPVKVVMRYADGRIIKGYTNDFMPAKLVLHVRPVESAPTERGVEVSVKELKAIFFVKDFVGDPSYSEIKDFPQGQYFAGRKVKVTFTDGEVLVGATLGYDPGRLGFFITPPDAQSNNLRVFVVSAAVSDFRYL